MAWCLDGHFKKIVGFYSISKQTLHQSLDYKTPDVVYRTSTGGGALIVDKFPHTVLVDENHVPIFSTEEEGSIEDGVEVKTTEQ